MDDLILEAKAKYIEEQKAKKRAAHLKDQYRWLNSNPANLERVREYARNHQKIYYFEHRDEIIQKRKEKYTCQRCGLEMCNSSKYTHNKKSKCGISNLTSGNGCLPEK